MLRTVIFGSFDNFEILRRLLQAVMFSCTLMNKMVFFGQSLWNSNDHFISKTDKEMDSLLNNFPTTLKVLIELILKKKKSFIHFPLTRCGALNSLVSIPPPPPLWDLF